MYRKVSGQLLLTNNTIVLCINNRCVIEVVWEMHKKKFTGVIDGVEVAIKRGNYETKPQDK
jgi:hypothetical protein